MTAQLTANLYRRPAPNTQLPGLSYLPMGSSLVVLQWVSGEHLDGNNLWAAADDGYYYWGGGLRTDELATAATPWPQLAEDVQISLVQDFLNHRRLWLQQQTTDYRGCAIGYKNDNTNGQIGLTVYVGAKQAGALPKLIRWKGVDIPVDVKETENVVFHLYSHPDGSTPIRIGGGITNAGTSSGTRSLIVSYGLNETGVTRRFLMTCFHVLLPDLARGQAIYQFDEKLEHLVNRYAQLPAATGVFEKLPVKFGLFTQYQDLALAELPNSTSIANIMPTDIADVKPGRVMQYRELLALRKTKLKMLGVSSNYQEAEFVDFVSDIYFDGLSRPFNMLIATKRMSKGGDSGAPVLSQDNRLVGIVIGGGREGKPNSQTYIMPLYSFFNTYPFHITK